MSANASFVYLYSLFFLLSVLFCACSEEEQSHRGLNKDTVRPGMDSIKARKRLKKKKSGLVEKKPDDDGKMDLPQLTETDFISGAENRDPFEPFTEILIKTEEVIQEVQRPVKLKEYDVASLKLIGIITNIGDPRAMVVVPDGTGFVLRRGDYVGRADYVKQGRRGEAIQVNWRVARIHGSGKEEERGVYFVRDDPTTTRGIDLTRFLPLFPH